ncbi:MAG: penicillin-binding protein 1A [Pseudomonadota bacterium]
MIRFLGYIFGIGAMAFLAVAVAIALYIGNVTKDLPDIEVLASYEPAITTRIHAADGRLMKEYATERRLYLPIQGVPERVKQAFISAEDKNFYSHNGIDYLAFGKAGFDYFRAKLTGQSIRARGASTITQQTTKNFLLTSDRTVDRKIKEAILALRIEGEFSKDQILELYLNEIYFGLGAYGIAGAALAYYDKSVSELTLPEIAYLAALPKGPSNYDPFKKTEAAIERRNYVLDRMAANGYVTFDEAEETKTLPLDVNIRPRGKELQYSQYFTEEVRRELQDRYGTDGLYKSGLSVRTTLDPELQEEARDALLRGLIRYDIGRGYRGPVSKVEINATDWAESFGDFRPLPDVPEWDLGIVLNVDNASAQVGIYPDRLPSGRFVEMRKTGTLSMENMKWAQRVRIPGEDGRTAKSVDGILSPGDLIFVQPLEPGSDVYRLRQAPEVSGALVAMDPHTGRVLAMQGGFSFSQSEFNRATQAFRQPGSSFKPFVYAAALDNGYTPSSVVLDAPVRINQGRELGIWEPKNYGGKAAGPSTLRLGIEKSRNLMTVRLAKDMSMRLVAEYAERFGIYDKMLPVLSMSLGSGETTVMRMVAGYSVLANGGKQITPSLIDRIQDRYGKTIYRHEGRACDACNQVEWSGQDEPAVQDTRDQVLDPMTAYQITSMMEGVVKRGTAAGKIKVAGDVAGKTGTTNDEKDAWFVGYTPDLVTGVYIGFDRPKPMGRGNTGGGLAAPVFNEFMTAALENTKPKEFRIPEGLKLIRINSKTGLATGATGPGTILEAFKPGTNPPDRTSVIGFASEEGLTISPQAQQAKQRGAGGLF